jgi:hypothetical protein
MDARELEWSEQEKAAIAELAQQRDLSDMGVLRNALRLYQLHAVRLAAGETCTWSGDRQRAREFAGRIAPAADPSEREHRDQPSPAMTEDILFNRGPDGRSVYYPEGHDDQPAPAPREDERQRLHSRLTKAIEVLRQYFHFGQDGMDAIRFLDTELLPWMRGEVLPAPAPRKGKPLPLRAAIFATEAHNGQVRKYNGRPYITHPMRVAHAALMLDCPLRVIAAAWLHDVVEDCPVTFQTIEEEFGTDVCELVRELTNPSKACPHLRRAERKAMDREHIAKASRWAKVLKLLDRTDNILEMDGCGDDFLALYAKESMQLVDAITDDDELIAILRRDLVDAIAAVKPAPAAERPVELPTLAEISTWRQMHRCIDGLPKPTLRADCPLCASPAPAAGEVSDGHGKPCYYCGKPCNNLTGRCSQWAVSLCHSDQPGVLKWHHDGCVSKRLEENATLTQRLADAERERDRLRAALQHIASGECLHPGCHAADVLKDQGPMREAKSNA